MKILMIAINDPAGTAITFTKAINRYTEHTCRLITKEIRYNFMFEKDLHLPWLDKDGWNEVEQLLKDSDIFHFHMTADESLELGPFKVNYYVKGKQIVHHHHGHPDFRSHPGKYRAKYKALKRRKLLVSTPDLLKLLPEAKWVPNLVPLDDPLYIPLDAGYNGKVVIGHSPTRREIKNTSDLVQVVNQLRPKMSENKLDLDVITNTRHKLCLKRKRDCHIIFDHMQGYFGVSSLESLSQGKPVIAGLDDWNVWHLKEFSGVEQLPWVVARNKVQLENAIGSLTIYHDRRRLIGEAGRNFMKTHWNQRRIVSNLVNFFEQM
jgi:hypothetical protein